MEFGIPSDAYISFVVSERGNGKKVVFEKGKVSGNPYENWSLEITPNELNCELENQIFENNNIYDYRIAVYSETDVGLQSFYLECYLLTKDIFSFEDVAYKAVVLSYAPGYYKEDSAEVGTQTIRVPFSDYKNNLTIASKYLNPDKTSIFGFDYVLEQHGGQDNLVFKSGTQFLAYDENTGLWYVPKEQLLNGEWNYNAQIEPVSWNFSTKFGWVDGDFLNAETGVAMHSYRRGFSYAEASSASGWTFGNEQTNNFNYKNGLTAETSDGLTGGPTQKLSVLQNDIRNTIDPNWEIFKSRYYDRYNIRGFQLNGVERTVGSSVYSLNTVDAPIIEMDSDLNLFIQNVELESSSGLSNRIEKDDLLTWTAVLDAQSRSVNVDWTIPSGYTAHWAEGQFGSHVFGPSDFSAFDFDLDVPVGVGVENYFGYHSSWPIDDEALTPISKGWALPKMYLESAGTYWILAGFTRGGSARFIQEGDAADNIIDIANEPNHYLWNVGDIWTEGYHTTGENVLVNNLDGNGTIYPIWGRAHAITLTYSFDEQSEESSYVPPVESSSSGELPSDSSFSSSSWNENWATEGYLLEKLQNFVDYMGQIGKTSVSQNLVSTSQIVDALDTIMENVGGLETSSSSLSVIDSGEVVTLGQVQNSFNAIETRFSAVSDMAYAYGNTQFTKVSQFSSALFGLNNQLVAAHSESPTILGGGGEIAFKADVDDVLESKITKYVSIAENVLDLKSSLESETSIGLVYLGEATVSLCNCLANFGLPNSREITRTLKSSKRVLRDVENDNDKLVETEDEIENSITRNDTIRKLYLWYELGAGCCVYGGSIVDLGNNLVDASRRFVMSESIDVQNLKRDFRVTSGYQTIKIIVPTFVNFKQASDLNWSLGWSSYSEQSVELTRWTMDGFYHGGLYDNEKGLERIESDDESIAIGSCYAINYVNDFLKYLTSAQKKVVSNTWGFPRMLTLTLSNTNLEIESNALSAIGTYVQREPPFQEWKQIYALAGMGTKIVLSIGADELMAMQGFPFGSSTKNYFECTKSTDFGYVIYDGTQWIKWIP